MIAASIVPILLSTLIPRAEAESAFWEEMATPGITDYRSLVSEGRDLIGRGELQRAVENLRLAQQRLPDQPSAHCWMGYALTRLARYEEAVLAWDRALAIDPTLLEDESLMFECSVCFARAGRYGRTSEIYRRMLSHGVSANLRPLVLVNLAEMLVAASCDDLETAIELYFEAVRDYPDRAGAHWGLGAALVRAGREDEATPELATALRLDPQWTTFTRSGNFFVPPYDRHFYQALGWEQNGDRERAANEWEVYLESGGAEGCWAEVARSHLTRLRSPRRGRRPRR